MGAETPINQNRKTEINDTDLNTKIFKKHLFRIKK